MLVSLVLHRGRVFLNTPDPNVSLFGELISHLSMLDCDDDGIRTRITLIDNQVPEPLGYVTICIPCGTCTRVLALKGPHPCC